MRVMIVAIACGCGGGGQSPPMEAGPPIEDAPDVIIVDALDAGIDHGFNAPALSLRANVEQSPDNWLEIGPADLSCLGTPDGDPATTVTVSLSTTVRDFQSDNLVPGATVAAFPTTMIGSPFAAPVTADANGKATVTIPTGTKRFGFDLLDDDSLRTIELGHIVAPGQANQTLAAVRPFSKSTAATLPALIGISRTPGTALVVGTFRDCQNREVSHFIATVSSMSGVPAHVAGADTYYFSSSVGLPVRHSQRSAASEDGQFMVIEVEPGAPSFIQVWGFPTDRDLVMGNLVLVAELAVPMLADTVIGGGLLPLRQ